MQYKRLCFYGITVGVQLCFDFEKDVYKWACSASESMLYRVRSKSQFELKKSIM